MWYIYAALKLSAPQILQQRMSLSLWKDGATVEAVVGRFIKPSSLLFFRFVVLGISIPRWYYHPTYWMVQAGVSIMTGLMVIGCRSIPVMKKVEVTSLRKECHLPLL